MSITAPLRYTLVFAVLFAASTADAKPRRVVVLDFDGPRTLADAGRTAVVTVLGEQYDIVPAKRWEDARAKASKTTHGPQSWQKAAKSSGVDAVIEGWVNDEGRSKVLTLAVREAATGREFDTVSVKIAKSGLSGEKLGELRASLDEVLDWIDGGTDPVTSDLPIVTPRELIGAKKDKSDVIGPELRDDDRDHDRDRDGDDDRDRDRDRDDRDRDDRSGRDRDDRGERGERTRKTPEVAAVEQEKSERNDLAIVLDPRSDEWPLPTKPNHVPRKTPRFMIGAGGFMGSRNLDFEADGDTDIYNAGGKGLSVNAVAYPFPTKKLDGVLSGVGFSFSVFQSAAGEVGIDTADSVGNYQYNHNGWDAAVHYRHAMGLVSIDSEVGYGRENYNLAADTPIEYEIPDTEYTFFHAGAHLDLHITDRATIGFGAKYLYVTDTGPMSDVDNWFGAGESSGLILDGNFVIPLPAQLYVRGELKYRRIKTVFDGSGIIADEEVVFNGVDSFIAGTANLGIQF